MHSYPFAVHGFGCGGCRQPRVGLGQGGGVGLGEMVMVAGAVVAAEPNVFSPSPGCACGAKEIEDNDGVVFCRAFALHAAFPPIWPEIISRKVEGIKFP